MSKIKLITYIGFLSKNKENFPDFSIKSCVNRYVQAAAGAKILKVGVGAEKKIVSAPNERAISVKRDCLIRCNDLV
jgi:hypothetical protein